MDGTVQVEVLRRHSEYVGTLVSQLTGTLTHLTQVFSAPPGLMAAETAGLLAQCAELESTLRAETDFLWRRLHFFVEDTKPGPHCP
ncbi:MAG TPA: hypothetical protein VKJ47_10065 [Candidatus Binatia bacterium]|nr:hypothetical protein [Candidatus Binatia bacterium]